jgi:tellurite resistance protein TehA-like permease
MKIFTTILIVLALGLVIVNCTLINLEKPFEGNSMIALIGIAASLCAIFILLIFKISKKIEEKLKQ